MQARPSQHSSRPRRALRDAFRNLRLLPYLVLAMSLAISVYFWFLYDISLRNRETLIYLTKTDQIKSGINKGLYDIELILRGAAGLFNASDLVTRDEWRRYVSQLELTDRFPGILGVGFSEWISPREKEAHERRVRGEGFPEYAITPPGERGSYTSIIYLEPFHWRNRRAFGFDMFSEPIRRRAMEQARDTGEPTIAATVVLVQETNRDRQNGMLMYFPVYRRGAPTGTVAQRRAALAGFVYSPVRVTDFMRSNLDPSVSDIAFQLASAGRGESESLLFSSSMLGKAQFPSKPYRGHDSQAVFDLYGRSWRISFSALPSFAGQAQRSSSYAVLAAGLLISGLLSLITFMMLAARDRAVTIAQMHREREERYRAYFNLPMLGFAIVSPAKRWIDVNQALCSMLGYDRQELQQLAWDDVIYPDDRGAEAAEFKRVLEGGVSGYSLDKRLVRKNGQVFWAALSAHAVRTATGEMEYLIAHLKDITQHREAEETLKKSEEKYRRLVEGLGARHCVFSQTADGTFLYLSRGSETLFGIPAQELVGRQWSAIKMTPEALRAREETDRRMIDARSSQVVAVTCIHPDGSHRIIEISYGPVIEDDKVVRMEGLCTDITEEITLQTQLQQAQKMESVGRLAGGVAHDFNNMLTVILGHAEMGLLKLDEGHPVAANLKEIRGTAERSANLTRQLLAFASKQAIAPKVIDLNDTVGAMLTMLQRLIGEDIHLVWEPFPELWPVKIDTSQIDQILANLCINSRDAIENTGTITLKTENCEIESSFCAQEPAAIPGQFVRLSVTDDGIGMDEETLRQIFEPFFTTKGLGHGTGLGLATVYGAVRQNNGFITVKSAPGAGSTFAIHLPRYQHHETRAPAEHDVVPLEHGRETILLVEDEEAILDLIAEMLNEQGYTVLASANPVEALRLAGEYKGPIDLVITDVIMPEMNGKELVGALVKERPEIRQLYMSGYTADVIAHHGVLDEGVHFIQKPFPIQTLASKVREVLDAG